MALSIWMAKIIVGISDQIHHCILTARTVFCLGSEAIVNNCGHVGTV